MIDNLCIASRRGQSAGSWRRALPVILLVTAALQLPTAVSGQSNTFPASGNVGIGTTNPSRKLVVSTDAGAPGPGFNGGVPFFRLEGNAGDWSEPMMEFAEQSSAPMAAIAGKNTGSGAGDLIFLTRLAANGSASEKVRIKDSGNVGIGTTNPQHLLHVAGTIGAEEVIVSATGADYVFQSDYRLSPLNDVSAYIKENHHLPGIASASEMHTEGVNVGDLQIKLLAKVEELTLHMIEAEERNSRLEQQNRKLQDRISRLEAAAEEPGRQVK